MKQMNNSCWGPSDKKCSKPLPEPHLPLKGTEGACPSQGECVAARGNELTNVRCGLCQSLHKWQGERGAEKECAAVV